MVDQVKNVCQADLAKLPFFSGDKTDTFTCKQWIARVQRSKDQQQLPANPWQEAANVPKFMALAVDLRARILLNLVDFGIQNCLDNVSLNLLVSSLNKNLDDAFNMAVQSEKINYAPPKAAGAMALPVLPVDQHNAPPPPEESEADLLAPLKDIEADNKSRVATIKTKLNKFHRNGQSSGNRPSSNRSSNKSSSGARKSNPDKDVKCRYCNKMGHYQLVCHSRKRDGAPMVANDGTPYTSCPNALMDMSGMAQVAAPLQNAPPGPAHGPGQVVYQSPYNMGYYQNPAPVFL
jgi:hypothetical protein